MAPQHAPHGGEPADQVELVQAAWRRELPGVDVDSVAVVGRMAQLVHTIDRVRGVALAAEGGDRATFDLLATLRRAGAPYRMSVGDLQRQSLVTTGAVSQRVERAERAGLVRRVATAEDGRKVMVELTAEGHDAAARMLSAVLAAEQTLLRPLSEDQCAALRDLLRTWSQGLTGVLGAGDALPAGRAEP